MSFDHSLSSSPRHFLLGRTLKQESHMAPVATKMKSSKKKANISNPFDVVEMVAESPNVQAADDIISAFYPTYTVKQKFEFLNNHFKFRIVSGARGTKNAHRYYNLVIKSILGKVRDFGIAAVKK